MTAWLLNKATIFEKFIMPALRRYDKTDALRVVVLIAFLHELFFLWLWVFTDRAIPEYLFYSLTVIVAGGLGIDGFYRPNSVNINMREGSQDVMDPDKL